MRIVLCDNDISVLEQLESLVKKYFTNENSSLPTIISYTIGTDLLQNENHVDIVFLTVEIPLIDGISIGKKLREINRNIKIFIIAPNNEYLDDAMRIKAFRYMIKPIDEQKFLRNIHDAICQGFCDCTTVSINTANKVLTLTTDDIICIEVIQRKCIIFYCGGIVQTKDRLEDWKWLLKFQCFYQSYRSYIINMKYIYKIKNDEVVLKFGNDEKKAYIARRKYVDFKSKYLIYLKTLE